MLFLSFLHELMHLIVGICVGFTPEALKLNPLGVAITFYHYGESGRKGSYKRIATYIAGPTLNFVIAVVCYFLNIEAIWKMKIIYTNILIGAFNCIPILPLDGGKIFKEILKIFFDNKVAAQFMIISSKIILAIMTVIYSIAILKIKNIAIFLLIIYLWYLYYLEEKKYKVMIKVYEAIQKI